MRILVLHSIPDSSVHYADNIDHLKHEVTYVSVAAKLATLPAGVPSRVVQRDGTGETVDEVVAAMAEEPMPDLVIATSEFDLLPAARLRERWGLPGATPDDVSLVRDKVVMKSAVASAGLRVPRFAPLAVVLAAGADAVAWRGRTVLKPLDSAGSAGVVIYPTMTALVEAVRQEQASLAVEDWEVEEFIDGRILHVDGLLVAGRPHAILASRYVGTCLAYAAGIPLGSVQCDTTPELVGWAVDCLKAVGIVDGLFHLEVIETPQGPVFLEVGARSGGRGMMDGFELATGVRLPGAGVRLQAEGPDNLPAPRIPDPEERYGWFAFPGHTFDPPYCRISGAEEFRDDPLVLQWHQRTPDQRIGNTLSYTPAANPLGAFLGPAPTSVLEQFITRVFASIRVEPTEPPSA